LELALLTRTAEFEIRARGLGLIPRDRIDGTPQDIAMLFSIAPDDFHLARRTRRVPN
jgi:hypothetical protein